MKQEIINQITHETAKSMASYYKVPYETAMSALSKNSTCSSLCLNPDDVSVIAEHAITGLFTFDKS